MTVRQEYDAIMAWGISSSIDLYDCNPQIIRSAESIKKFVNELCDLIKVKKFGECTVVNFGEREEIAGYSMTQLIETSLISGHFANKTNTVYLDVFSCKFYNPEIVATKAKEFFVAQSVTLKYTFRK